ncbi:MAG: hypothetical protein KDD53_13130, partial [Bdellovibrionales bacterium]|nr:hypothetical protein [Bdellovibrionales bacterium]
MAASTHRADAADSGYPLSSSVLKYLEHWLDDRDDVHRLREEPHTVGKIDSDVGTQPLEMELLTGSAR